MSGNGLKYLYIMMVSELLVISQEKKDPGITVDSSMKRLVQWQLKKQIRC